MFKLSPHSCETVCVMYAGAPVADYVEFGAVPMTSQQYRVRRQSGIEQSRGVRILRCSQESEQTEQGNSTGSRIREALRT